MGINLTDERMTGMKIKKWILRVFMVALLSIIGLGSGMAVYAYWVEQLSLDWTIPMRQDVVVRVTGLVPVEEELLEPEVALLVDEELELSNQEEDSEKVTSGLNEEEPTEPISNLPEQPAGDNNRSRSSGSSTSVSAPSGMSNPIEEAVAPSESPVDGPPDADIDTDSESRANPSSNSDLSESDVTSDSGASEKPSDPGSSGTDAASDSDSSSNQSSSESTGSDSSSSRSSSESSGSDSSSSQSSSESSGSDSSSSRSSSESSGGSGTDSSSGSASES